MELKIVNKDKTTTTVIESNLHKVNLILNSGNFRFKKRDYMIMSSKVDIDENVTYVWVDDITL